ncbi:MAG: dTMP kinase [Candidatus Bipolaricaulia bacterium]
MRYLLWIAAILALDQSSKLLALAQLEPYEKVKVIDHLLYLTLTRNPGGAFGLLQGHGLLVIVVTAAISLGLLGALLFTKLRDGQFKLGLAIIAGGALGNLLDRARLGYVVDFIDLRFWTVFNLADVAIVTGTALILFHLLRRAGPHGVPRREDSKGGKRPPGAGLLIAIEGLDGSGKTTQARLLVEHLRNRGKEVLLVGEPGTTPAGLAIREILLDHGREIAPLTELLLYEASRAQLVKEVIEPALKAGKIVVADRFALSSLAYQGYGRGLPLRLVQKLNEVATGGLEPDLTILLDISPEEGLRRKGFLDRMEGSGLEFYRRVREGYLRSVPRPPRGQVLDAHAGAEELFQRIAALVEAALRCAS